MSLLSRVTLTEKDDLSGSALGKAVEKAASKITKKPLHVDKHKVSAKGHDFTFKEGGQFKIRPKPDGAVLAKLQGQPKPHYRYLGVGTDAATAIAALKPEKGVKPKGIGITPQQAKALQKKAAAKPKKGKKPGPVVVKGVPPVKWIADPNKPGVQLPNPDYKAWFMSQLPEVQTALGDGAKALVKGSLKAKAKAEMTPGTVTIGGKKVKVVYGPKSKGGMKKSTQVPANVNGLRLFDDIGVSDETWKNYTTAAKDSVDLLKRFGFGFMLKNVTMHLRTSNKPGVAGNYDMKSKQVEIFVNVIGLKASSPSIMTTMVHELGHHYYYREIPRGRRKSYRWYFDMAKKPTVKGGKTGDFPSDYGATVRYEDFAEIFAAFYGRAAQLKPKRYKLTPDIMDRFRTFMKQDDRIKVYEDEDTLLRRPLTTVNIFETASAELWGHKPKGWTKQQERAKKQGQEMCGFRPCKPGEKRGAKGRPRGARRGAQPQAWGYQQ